MAGIFEQPRNAGTLCELPRPVKFRSSADPLPQSSEVKKSVELIYEIKMVSIHESRALFESGLSSI